MINTYSKNMRRYELIETSLKKVFGEISFNGKFTFTLASDVTPEMWRTIGIIPIKDGMRSVEEIREDQFYYLNSRLPLNLRNSSIDKKLEYVDETGLEVISDNFILKKISE